MKHFTIYATWLRLSFCLCTLLLISTFAHAQAPFDICWEEPLPNGISITGDNYDIDGPGFVYGGATLPASGGTVEFELISNPNNSAYWIGLGQGTTNSAWQDLIYSMDVNDNGNVTTNAYINGGWQGGFISLTTNDVLRISYDSNNVTFYKNGSPIVTKPTVHSGDLQVMAYFNVISSNAYEETIDVDASVVASCGGSSEPLEIEVSKLNASSNQNDGKLILDITGGTGPYAVTWSNGTTENANKFNFELINLPPDVYSVTVTDANNETINIDDDPVAVIQICAEKSVPNITMDNFIGTNYWWNDYVTDGQKVGDALSAIGFLREYHEWYPHSGISDDCFDEGTFCDQTPSPVYPNEQYKFSDTYSCQAGSVSFDEFYNKFFAAGEYQGEFVANMLRSSPNVLEVLNGNRKICGLDAGEDGESNQDYLEKNPATLANFIDPNAYVDFASYLFQFVYRYGQVNPMIDQETTSKIVQSLETNSQSNLKPLGSNKSLSYIEVFNEQDKWWLKKVNAQLFGDTYITPQQYAAMLSATADGHEGEMLHGTHQYPLGICNADPNMRIVMGGLAELDPCYTIDMLDWLNANRTQHKFPLDVMNFHHYSRQAIDTLNVDDFCGENSPDEIIDWTYGISPEEDDLRGKLHDLYIAVTDIHPSMSSKEWWLSEFGYDTHPGADQAAISLYDPVTGQNDFRQNITNYRNTWTNSGNSSRNTVIKNHVELTQAQWLVRSYLDIATTQFDRAMSYEYADRFKKSVYDDFGKVDKYRTSGLVFQTPDVNDIDEDGNTTEIIYERKVSWYFVNTMKQLLTDYQFDSDVSNSVSNQNIRVYRFTKSDAEDIWAVWLPTNTNTTLTNVQLNLGITNAQATVIGLADGQSLGTFENVTVDNGNVTYSVNETPIFIRAGATNCTTIGQPCDDNDDCTVEDKFDNNCNCIGTFADSDVDGVCDANDACPGSDDSIDINGNNIPDGCDPLDCVEVENNAMLYITTSNNSIIIDNLPTPNYIIKVYGDGANGEGDNQCSTYLGECILPATFGPFTGNSYNVEFTLTDDDGSSCNFTVVNVSLDGSGCPDDDGDGVCNDDDCQPLNPNLPTTPGTACDDNDSNTINDEIQSDGCTCEGTPSGGGTPIDCENFTIIYGNGSITVENNTPEQGIQKINLISLTGGWSSQTICDGSCNNPHTFSAMPNQDYQVQAFTPNYSSECTTESFTLSDGGSDPCATQGGDSDGDGVCDDDDCQPLNPNLPTTPGTACDDNDSNTINDEIQSDGCTCEGTPSGGGTPISCENFTITYGNGSITVENNTPGQGIQKIELVDITNGWSSQTICVSSCNNPHTFSAMPNNDYRVKAFRPDYSFCETPTFTLSGGGNSLAYAVDDNIRIHSRKVDEKIQVKWNTRQILSGDYFEIERSTNGGIFKKVGRTEAVKDVSDFLFSWLDEEPVLGENKYRVHQISMVGLNRLSDITSQTNYFDAALITIYPNPVKEELRLNLGRLAHKTGIVRIYNILGIPVMEVKTNQYTDDLRFDTSNFENGLYYIGIHADNQKVVTKSFIVETLK